MTEVNFFDAIVNLEEKIQTVGTTVRELRAKILPELADKMLSTVKGNVSRSLHDGNGKISGWQALSLHKGYAAVRPVNGNVGASSPGAITNYLESGHRIRRPSGVRKRYTPRVHVGRVQGRHFYRSSGEMVETMAAEAAAEVERVLKEVIEK